ncbi:MAG: TerB family tellurite resistance protein, partial [Pseudomonadota bacterium]
MRTGTLPAAAAGRYMAQMLDRIMKTLAGHDGPPTRLAPRDARDALAVILVHAARSDGRYDDAERADIDRVLTHRYGLGPAEAAALRAEAERDEENAAGLQRFTSALKNAVAFEERVGIIEAVWEVAYADGARSHEESALVRKLCGLLYVEDRDAGLARQRVVARL